MNLSFIEAFYWAATLRSVSRAAKKLFVTQPALSARIAVLEQELGTPLLDRREKHFRLTLAGQGFLVDAQRLLELWRTSKANVGSGGTRPATLRMGAIESVLHSWLMPWLERLKAEQPSLQLELTVETTPVLLDLGRRGALDVVLATLPVGGDDVRTRPLPEMPMVFVGKQGLHQRRQYTLRQLAEHDLLTFQRGSQPHVALLDLLREAGVEAPRVHAISSISAMVRLVSSGYGVAMLPRPAIDSSLQSAGLRLLKADAEPAALPIHASWRADPASDLVADVVQSALEFARATPPRARSSKKSMS
jgi:DNA-binding transcriptional LysR family regulator